MKRKPKTAQFHIVLTEEERSKFLKLADQRHTNISELIRQLLHKEADHQQVAA